MYLTGLALAYTNCIVAKSFYLTPLTTRLFTSDLQVEHIDVGIMNIHFINEYLHLLLSLGPIHKIVVCTNKNFVFSPMVPEDDFLKNALVRAETSISLSGKSNEFRQPAQSTDGPKNHWDLVFILSVCLSCTYNRKCIFLYYIMRLLMEFYCIYEKQINYCYENY